ncbi:hypothetical protein [Streptomyces sp. bgisy153]|uniref:hypothetical protein n=1 Tax=Streptomyces sp. bgisy153 TaxID=3413793 RepID=UPI003D7406FB
MGEWYAICAIRYVLVLGAGYAVACAVAPLDPEPDRAFWPMFIGQLVELADLLAVLAPLALFLLLLLGLIKQYGSTAVFRAWAAALLLLPLVPLWLGGIGGFTGIMMLTNIAFACRLMPAPPLRPLY